MVTCFELFNSSPEEDSGQLHVASSLRAALSRDGRGPRAFCSKEAFRSETMSLSIKAGCVILFSGVLRFEVVKGRVMFQPLDLYFALCALGEGRLLSFGRMLWAFGVEGSLALAMRLRMLTAISLPPHEFSGPRLT